MPKGQEKGGEVETPIGTESEEKRQRKRHAAEFGVKE